MLIFPFKNEIQMCTTVRCKNKNDAVFRLGWDFVFYFYDELERESSGSELKSRHLAVHIEFNALSQYHHKDTVYKQYYSLSFFRVAVVFSFFLL